MTVGGTAAKAVDPADPAGPVGGRWVGALSLANLGVWVGWFGPLQLLLARQAEQLTPDHKAATLALVTGVGAAVSMVANPVFGALSDRTTASAGRRIPWVVAGTLGGAAGLLVLARASSLPVVIAGWCLVQLALNAAFAALTAAVPDQVPPAAAGWSAAGSGSRRSAASWSARRWPRSRAASPPVISRARPSRCSRPSRTW